MMLAGSRGREKNLKHNCVLKAKERYWLLCRIPRRKEQSGETLNIRKRKIPSPGRTAPKTHNLGVSGHRVP